MCNIRIYNIGFLYPVCKNILFYFVVVVQRVSSWRLVETALYDCDIPRPVSLFCIAISETISVNSNVNRKLNFRFGKILETIVRHHHQSSIIADTCTLYMCKHRKTASMVAVLL